MPVETSACASVSISASSTAGPNAFQLFQPMGGVGARPRLPAGAPGLPTTVDRSGADITRGGPDRAWAAQDGAVAGPQPSRTVVSPIAITVRRALRPRGRVRRQSFTPPMMRIGVPSRSCHDRGRSRLAPPPAGYLAIGAGEGHTTRRGGDGNGDDADGMESLGGAGQPAQRDGPDVRRSLRLGHR